MGLSNDFDRRPTRSLWRDLADGGAGIGVRLAVSVVFGLFLAGAALVASYGASYVLDQPPFHYPARLRSATFVYVDEETMAVVFLIAGALYLSALFCVWSPSSVISALTFSGDMSKSDPIIRHSLILDILPSCFLIRCRICT